MLPADAIVLLVQADNIRVDFRLAVRTDNNRIEILNHAETVAAQREVVGAVTGASIAEVEGLLAVKGRTSIRIWN
jgi:hypothetical protein